jgi:hypothetical protein
VWPAGLYLDVALQRSQQRTKIRRPSRGTAPSLSASPRLRDPGLGLRGTRLDLFGLTLLRFTLHTSDSFSKISLIVLNKFHDAGKVRWR